jgi:VanZ family protein
MLTTSQSFTSRTSALVCWVCFVAFGSWYPFSFDGVSLSQALDIWLYSIGDRKAKTDILVNLIVGVPTGFLTYLWLSRFVGERFRRVFDTICIAGLSLLICLWVACFVEIGQVFFRGRDPSVVDSICQLLGSIAGMFALHILGDPTQKFDRKIQWNWDRLEWPERITGFGAVLLLTYQVWPLIPSISPSELKAKLALLISSFRVNEIAASWKSLSILSALGLALVFFLSSCTGFFYERICRKLITNNAIALRAILVVLFVFLEFSKLFIENRLPDLFTLFACLVGLTTGIAIGRKDID